MKSLVWYSPQRVPEAGYAVPTTLDELKQLSDRMVSEGKKPWCAGISSGEATGWPITDWHEDMMLRLSGPDVYDQWVEHEIPFNGPESTAALDKVGEYLKNDAYVNGGLGDVKSIATTTFQDGGLPITRRRLLAAPPGELLRLQLARRHQGGRGRRRLRVLPARRDADDQAGPRRRRVRGGVQRQARGPGVPGVPRQRHVGQRQGAEHPQGRLGQRQQGPGRQQLLVSPIDQLAANILLDPKAVFRFDGSDQMPAAIGSNAYWKQSTNWITGQDTKTTVDAIEKAWPAKK